MRWQKRARFGVALFGIVFAVIVYFAIGERQQAAPAARPTRLDPKAIIESAGAILQQFRQAKQDYEITADRQLTYEGGATKLVNIKITVRGREGRDFVVTGREAQASEGQKQLKIIGDVKLMASDGFVITAADATFDEEDATVDVPGAVEFSKGGMSGSGIGMKYDQKDDVLALKEQAHVEVKDGEGETTTDFTAGSATLARQENYLSLEGSVHVLRGEQVLEADKAVARLTENEEFITFIELRGNSRVVGGGAFDSMTARDIDLDYTDDGAVLERVKLTGGGAIVMVGRDGGTGRQILGDTLDLAFAADKTLTNVVGRNNVRLDLPAAPNAAARSVKARAMDAAGEAGKGLTNARFADDVEYREEARAGGAARVARSRALQVVLADDAITSAVFQGNARFEEQGLQASGGTAQYDPAKGALRLAGVEAGRGPRVADEQINIEADAVDVTLDGRRMMAKGNVKTTLQPPKGEGANATRLPGLLQQDLAANVNANLLDYQGEGGKAIYSGEATLWQGETAVRGDVITLDQKTGDLLATGAARVNLLLDKETSIGRASQIRYEDKERRVTLGAPPAPPAPASAEATAGKPAAPVTPSQLNGPQGNLQAARIEIILASGGGRAERLEAYTTVTARVDTRIATGDRLTYFTEDERYLLSGIATVPVKIVEAGPGCRETTGRTVTFFKSTERIIVDGKEEIRTQSRRGAACPQPAR
jgi:LPS export ABC transporter protein LptC